MSVRTRTQYLLTGCLGLLALSACSGDPASEEAIKLQPGLYLVTIGGGAGMPKFSPAKVDGGKEGDDSVCLSSGDDLDKLKKLVRKHFAFNSSCSPKLKPRVGNFVSGQLSCPNGAVELVTSFEGSLAVDAINLDGEMLWSAPAADGAQGKEENAIGFTLTATRQRDCG